MGTTRTTSEINQHRRRFFGAAAMTVAAAQLGIGRSASAQPGRTEATQPPVAKSRAHTSFEMLGSTDRQHRSGALARALQGPGLREWLSDQQPGSRQDAVAAKGRA